MINGSSGSSVEGAVVQILVGGLDVGPIGWIGWPGCTGCGVGLIGVTGGKVIGLCVWGKVIGLWVWGWTIGLWVWVKPLHSGLVVTAQGWLQILSKGSKIVPAGQSKWNTEYHSPLPPKSTHLWNLLQVPGVAKNPALLHCTVGGGWVTTGGGCVKTDGGCVDGKGRLTEGGGLVRGGDWVIEDCAPGKEIACETTFWLFTACLFLCLFLFLSLPQTPPIFESLLASPLQKSAAK